MSPEIDKISEIFTRYRLLSKGEINAIFRKAKRILKKWELEMMVDGLYETFLREELSDTESKICTLAEIEMIVVDLLESWKELSRIFSPNSLPR
ncbi:hypothetical protein HF1_04990 [Mycoplasma haemofelis str. Langford 1]|uniref:Uncharacterized protein n=1 Tax=Mycoplasma haemofelis (strain Langford 1) TaxID=941640 RepID=E8ZH86_MYCHL|nr:hypothetical protein [Mycoplasma haemofelis]CBY92507.1 hypothetical protein HF1_04990 [Mycoplasma haemofelis str. Langford 1]